MCCQEEEEEQEEQVEEEEKEEEEEEVDHVPGLGTRTGSTLLFSTTVRFCAIKQG